MKNKQMKKQKHLPHPSTFFYLLPPEQHKENEGCGESITLHNLPVLHGHPLPHIPAACRDLLSVVPTGDGHLLHGPLLGFRELLLCRNALCFFFSNRHCHSQSEGPQHRQNQLMWKRVSGQYLYACPQTSFRYLQSKTAQQQFCRHQ